MKTQDQTHNFCWGGLWQRRRVRVWAALVLSVVGLLSVQVVFPHWTVIPQLSPGLGPMTVLVVFLVALGCEFIDSSLGMGYGTTLTPLLLLAGFQPLQIVPCVLLSECITGLGAGLMHHRDGNINLVKDPKVRETVLLLSILSSVGAVAAVFIALKVSKFWLTAIIAIIILSVGITILATIRRQFRYSRLSIVIVGTVAAFNKGLSGGGYGPLTTAGQVVSGLSPKQAVAITSLAESLTCLVGLIAYVVLNKGQLDMALAMPMTLGAVLSVPVATLAVRQLSEKVMRACVGFATCALALVSIIKMLF